MSVVNLKGGFNVSMRVTQNSSNEVTCMLKKPFLKKASNWSLQITDFHTNKTPQINLELKEQLRIVPLGAGVMNLPQNAPYYAETDYIFTPVNCYTVCEWVTQLQEFFRRFSYRFWHVGINGVMGMTPAQTARVKTAARRADTAINISKHNFVNDPTALMQPTFIDVGFAAVEADGTKRYPTICSAAVTNDLRVTIILQPVFLANFYIRVSAGTHRRLQFPGIDLFFLQAGAVANPVNDVITPAALFNPDGTMIAQVAARGVPTAGKEVHTGNSIQELDERVSLDLESVFPASRKISVQQGEEVHEYILARFDLNNFKTFEATTRQDESRMSDGVEITESFQAGLENLTRFNPDYEANYLLPGSIQQVTLRLWTRYMEAGVIRRVATDMNDGYFHARLLFAKKV